jgi:hypothetical protein
MDEKEPSPSVLAGVPDPAQVSFVPIFGQKRQRQVFVLGVKLLVSAVILCYLVHTQRLGIMRIRDAWHSPVQLWAALAFFFDTILPGGAADVIRGYYLDRSFRLQHRVRALTTVVVDRLFGIMGLVLAALGALVLKSYSIASKTALHSLELISSVARRSRPLGFCYR